jgi:hypothetical protein
VRTVDSVTVAALRMTKAALPKSSFVRRAVEIGARAITKTAVIIADTFFVGVFSAGTRDA